MRTGWDLSVAGGILTVFIGPGVWAFFRYRGDWPVERLAAFFQIIYTIATVFMLALLYVSARYAKRQLDDNRRSSELRARQEILERYLEDRELFTARDFVHRHMDNLNRVIAKIVADSRERPENERAAYLSGRRKDIEDETKRLSEDKIQLLDIYLVINTFNHASWPILLKL